MKATKRRFLAAWAFTREAIHSAALAIGGNQPSLSVIVMSMVFASCVQFLHTRPGWQNTLRLE